MARLSLVVRVIERRNTSADPRRSPAHKGEEAERYLRRSGDASCQPLLILFTAFAAFFVGCTTVLSPPTKNAMQQLLAPATTPPDSVTLEIFHARVPIDKEDSAVALWNAVDEQCFDVELRRRLLANGLRVGVVGGTPSPELADLLALQGEAEPTTAERIIKGQSATPRVTRRVVQIDRRDQSQIQTSDVLAEATVLTPDESGVHGTTYNQVQGVYGLRAQAIEGQRVHVELVPELQHGDLRGRYTPSDQGIFMLTQSRERVVFDKLALEADLGPGDMLLLGCLPDASTSLGGVLHAGPAEGRRERKLVVVRVLETPRSEIHREE